jgi:hypothetical protein
VTFQPRFPPPSQWLDGEVFGGYFVDGKPHGAGVKSWPDGEMYSGEWNEGERSGNGMWNGPTGDDYQGEYRRDKRNGVGCYQFAQGASGATYEGEFKDGKPHGTGVYTFRSGKRTLDQYRCGEEVLSEAYDELRARDLLQRSVSALILRQRIPSNTAHTLVFLVSSEAAAQ